MHSEATSAGSELPIDDSESDVAASSGAPSATRPIAEALAFLAGGGEMGERMRELDWSTTPLGLPDGWPRSLKTCVRIMLTSRRPMLVWWGPEHILLYNDANIEVLAGKHPAALGQPASKVWREIWHRIGEPAHNERLANGDRDGITLPVVIERNGYPEESHHTFSYSAIPDDDGGPGGFVITNSDDTRRVLDGRGRALCREIAAKTAEVTNVDEACARVAEALATNARDVPLALFYLTELTEAGGATLRLAASAGVARGQTIAPESVLIGTPESSSPWPLARVVTSNSVVQIDDLTSLHGLPRGGWDIAPRSALALPLTLAGENRVTGVLVVGLHPYRRLDEAYRGLLARIGALTSSAIAKALTAPAGDEVVPVAFDEESSAPTTAMRIVLADDEPEMRTTLARLLRDRWVVESVGDGVAALEAIRRAPPDLVITDVMMPKLGGFGLLRALRADPETRRIPVIMLSARGGEESRVEGLEAGADDYLPKPFSPRELVARVASHLHISHLRSVAERGRAKLYDLFMRSPAPLAMVMGAELRFAVANAAFCEILGRSGVVGMTVREAFPEYDEHDFAALIESVFQSGEPRREMERGVRVMRRGELVEAYFDYALQPLRDASGAVTGIMIVASDVTEQVLARRHIDTLREEAEKANRAKDEFLAMLGHELRNPLAPIVTALQLLRLRGGGGEREREVIERQVQHLVRLVDDLLDVSRITRGKVELEFAPVELAEVVASAIEVASPLLEHGRHYLRVDVPSRGLAVDADATRLSQVVSNLLTNAAKYTPRGGNVTVSARREGSEVVLRVRDDGVGISREMLPRVFDLFAQERQALDRSMGGLGLGLAIVKSLVDGHGGRVAVHSEGTNRGSEFVVALPAACPRRSSAPASREVEAKTRPSPDALRVLVVDDNEDAAHMLRDWLLGVGHDVRVARDGLQALEFAERFDPDVILLDIGLPVMDGYEVARRLRQRGLGRTKLFAVTGYGQSVDRAHSARAGFEAHLVKPVDLRAVGELLANVRPKPTH